MGIPTAMLASSPRSLKPRAPGLSTRALAALGLILGCLAGPGHAVLIVTGDGTGNTTAPAADPGFANVGVVNGLSGVYIRNGWVLTANHVGTHPINLGGLVYTPIAGSTIRFENSDSTLADLIAFKLSERPLLPDLLITDGPMSMNTLVTLVGNGLNRGAATSWNGKDGFEWDSGRSVRWGTNRVDDLDESIFDTWSFRTSFNDLPGVPSNPHEADVVHGDSGGAAFIGSGASAELVGILFARAGYGGQPSETSLYGNTGFAADLWIYRDDLLTVIDTPDCSDGLDDDGDGLIDHPDDPGCSSPTDASEREATLACDNTLDDDGDGTIDLEDGGCDAPGDTSERGAPEECDNGLDDDGDLLADFPSDQGCLHPTNLYELPEPGLGKMLAWATLTLTAAARRRPVHAPFKVERDRAADALRSHSSARSTR